VVIAFALGVAGALTALAAGVSARRPFSSAPTLAAAAGVVFF